MGGPPMPRQVKVTTPGMPSVDPDSGNERPGLPMTKFSPAWLSQRSVVDISRSLTLVEKQDTTTSLWLLLVPLDTPLTRKSLVTERKGDQYKVVSEVARRPDHRPLFFAAVLALISDMQTNDP